MEITVKKLPGSRVELSVRVSWEDWRKELETAAKELSKSVKLPGFRPGNVPKNVLEQRVGKGAILGEAAEHTVRHSYLEALKKENVQAIGEPKVDLKNLKEGEALEYVAMTAVIPEVSLGNFSKAIKKINQDFGETTDEVDEKDITAELEKLALMRAPLVAVERKAKTGDTVTIDFTVSQNGVVIENGTSTDHAVALGKNVFIPGFEENLVGMKAGEEKTFTLEFPKNYHAEHLSGKPAQFAVKVKKVEERTLPVIDDAFAQTLGKFENLEKVKESLRRGMADEKKAKRREERRSRILDVLVAEADIDMPELLIERELDRMTSEFEARTKSMGLSLDDALKQGGKTKEDLRKEWAPQAKKRVAAYLILEHLAKQEQVEVKSSEVEVEMNKTLQYYRSADEAKKVDMEHLYQGVREHLRNEKVFEWLESL